MNAIRSALFILFQGVTVVPWAFLCLLCAPLPLPMRYKVTMGWCQMCIWAARVICGIQWRVIGTENLPDKSVILLSKHQSTWETLFYPSYFDRELCYVFKRELLYLPFFGWGIGLLKMIHIDRKKGGSAFDQVADQGAQKLAENRSIIMFPEGTRIPVGQQGKYKSGGTRLAIRTNATIVPIAVNSGEVWPKNAFVKTPGLVTVSIGPPIEIEGRSANQLAAVVEQWTESEMRRISPHIYHSDHA